MAVAEVFVGRARAAKDDLVLVSRQSAADGGAAANAQSYSPSISADGRYVAFESEADNLSSLDTDRCCDVFVRDLLTDTTRLVNRQSASDGGARSSAEGGPSLGLAISANGRYVAFSSPANNLSDVDADRTYDVFVRDLQRNTTTLVSRQSASDGGAPGNRGSIAPAISADGRFIAFSSYANNLSPLDSDHNYDVFVRDIAAQTTTLVSSQSAADGGRAGAYNDDDDPEAARLAISADGRYVAFPSWADDLSTSDTHGRADLFVRDLQTDTTTLVDRQSASDGGAVADGLVWGVAMSGDGRYVAFSSEAENLSRLDTGGRNQVYVRDLRTDTTTLVSRESASDGDLPGQEDDSSEAAISADGRYVSFASEADNLSRADVDNNDVGRDIFVRDLQTHTTTLVSRQGGGNGAAADRDSFEPAISADGRYIAFESEADNLSSIDSPAADVFRRDVLGGPEPASQPLRLPRVLPYIDPYVAGLHGLYRTQRCFPALDRCQYEAAVASRSNRILTMRLVQRRLRTHGWRVFRRTARSIRAVSPKKGWFFYFGRRHDYALDDPFGISTTPGLSRLPAKSRAGVTYVAVLSPTGRLA